MTNLDSTLKSRDVSLPTKGHIVKALVFPVVIYRCESWTIMKAECWRTDASELWCWQLRVPWTVKRWNQSILKKKSTLNIHWVDWCNAEAEAPILWLPDVKCWLIEKDHDVGKNWGQEEKMETEGEMVGWYCWLNRHEFEQTLGNSEGQGSLACFSSWGHKKSNTT